MIIIDKEKCIGCGLCVKDCLTRAIKLNGNKAEQIGFCFECGHCIAICPQNAVVLENHDASEVKEYDKKTFDISSENLENFIRFRRSIRHFKDKHIEKEKLEKLIDVAHFGPTACNAQNINFIVIQDNIKEFNNLAMSEFRKLPKESFKPPFDISRIYFEEDDFLFKGCDSIILTISPSDVNGTIAAANIELMANTMGLGMLYCGFFVRLANENEAIKNYLGLYKTDHIVNCLCLGYPNVSYKRTTPRHKPSVKWM